MHQSIRRWRRRPDDRPLPLFDRVLDAPPRRSPPAATSQAAARSVEHARGYIEQRIIDYLARCGPAGATADEAEVALDLAQATGSARFSELTKAGRIVRTGRTRRTRRGRAAFVHVHPTYGGGGDGG